MSCFLSDDVCISGLGVLDILKEYFHSQMLERVGPNTQRMLVVTGRFNLTLKTPHFSLCSEEYLRFNTS